MGMRLLQKNGTYNSLYAPLPVIQLNFAKFSIVDQDLDLELTEMDQVTVV